MPTRGSYCSVVGVLARLATHGNTVLTAHASRARLCFAQRRKKDEHKKKKEDKEKRNLTPKMDKVKISFDDDEDGASTPSAFA